MAGVAELQQQDLYSSAHSVPQELPHPPRRFDHPVEYELEGVDDDRQRTDQDERNDDIARRTQQDEQARDASDDERRKERHPDCHSRSSRLS